MLVTGAGGFVGAPLVGRLRAEGHDVVAAGHHADVLLDLRAPDDVVDLVAEARPDVVVHLGGTTSPDEYARDPAGGHVNVVRPAVNVLEAVLAAAPGARVLLGSCAQVYGRTDRLPIDEACPLQPAELYGAARAAVEYMLRSYRERGLGAVVARIFLVAGPGQPRRTMLGEWAARAAAGEGTIAVGDLELRRDVVDVRDVVEGLALLATHGVPGEAYNLCGGTARRLGDLFAAVAPGATPVHDPARVRRGEPTVLLGSPAKAEALGWRRRYTVEETLAAIATV